MSKKKTRKVNKPRYVILPDYIKWVGDTRGKNIVLNANYYPAKKDNEENQNDDGR